MCYCFPYTKVCDVCKFPVQHGPSTNIYNYRIESLQLLCCILMLSQIKVYLIIIFLSVIYFEIIGIALNSFILVEVYLRMCNRVTNSYRDILTVVVFKKIKMFSLCSSCYRKYVQSNKNVLY